VKSVLDLFNYQAKETAREAAPLAERMRPETLDDFIGQDHITGADTVIRSAIAQDRIFSMILWGPPGCGKTTLAGIIAGETQSNFKQISAVLAGIKDIRAVVEEAKEQLQLYRKRSILFVDEIHRFNKAQQDAFLNHVESGLITLIGATTENPSFEVISPLLSRCRLIQLKPLSPEALTNIINKALGDTTRGFGNMDIGLSSDALSHLIEISDGDARAALNNLEIVVLHVQAKGTTETGEKIHITPETLEKSLQVKALKYDKSGEEHFNLISAFHKSLRGSDPDAAAYWLGRMLFAGENPMYIARRMVRFASEDIGNADPYALNVALNAMEAFRFLGHPEGDLALFQSAVYLATAPKTNSIYTTYQNVMAEIEKTGSLPVPMHIRNAPTKMMKTLGYGKNYQYAHDHPGAFVPQKYLPDALANRYYYHPKNRGHEKIIKKRLDKWRSLQNTKDKNSS